MDKSKINPEWWKESHGFFGYHYMDGDNSVEGYLERKQSLEQRTQREVEGLESHKFYYYPTFCSIEQKVG